MNTLAPRSFVISAFGRAVLFLSLLSSIYPLAAQKTAPQSPFDVNTLRSQFAAAVGKDFEIVKDEFKRRANARGGGTYWLVHVKPKHAGYFKFTYRYNYNDPHYSHVEREFGLGVGRKGCRRGPPSYGSYSRFCLGDTIIFPIAINNFTEHQFTLTSTEHTKEADDAFETAPEPQPQSLDRSWISTTLVDDMRYLGSTSHKLLHRNGGYTLEAYATLEAQRPGRFNLALSVALPGVRKTDARSGVGSVPIIIVARDKPLTLLASRHEVRGYTKGYDGREYVSSTSGDSFMTDLIILQPGDRISLKYSTSVRSRNYERRELADNSQSGDSSEKVPPPFIIKLPFALDTEYNFTEWLVDYLPH